MKTSHQKRIHSLQKRIRKENIDALIIENLVDIFYLTGKTLSAGKLCLTPSTAALLVDGRYFESCSELPCSVFCSPPLSLKAFLDEHMPPQAQIACEKSLSYASFLALKEQIPQGMSIEPIDSPIKELRLIKDHREIETLRKAAQLNSAGFLHIRSLLQAGVSEEELKRKLLIFWQEQEGASPSFPPIIAFGAHSALPHHSVSNKKLQSGDIVLLDMGVSYDAYQSDMTRTLFYKSLSSRFSKLYDIVREAQEAALEIARPGCRLQDLDAIARDIITEAGYGDFFTHRLGHGLGLEIHEHPFFKKESEVRLEAGMLLTIEPGIYLAGEGGIRIEDSILITENGHENLSLIPKTLEIIDA